MPRPSEPDMYTPDEVDYFRAAVVSTAIMSTPWAVGLALAVFRRERHPGLSLLAGAGVVVLTLYNVGLLLNTIAQLDHEPYHPRFGWLGARGILLLGQGLLIGAVFAWRPAPRTPLAGPPGDAASPAPRPGGEDAIRSGDWL